MAAFGTQINPALGRIDYSPLLQGAQMAAAGRQRGTEVLQQGISQGFEDYLKKREQNAVLEGRNASLIRAFAQDPTLKNFAPDQKALDSLMAKMAKGGGLTLNDNMKLNAELQTTVDLAEKAREAQMKQVYAEQARASVNKMAYDLDQAKKTDEAWGRWSELSRGFTDKTTYDEKVKAVAEAGLPPEAASRALGNVINAEQLGLARERAALDKRLADQKLKEDAANSDFLADVRNNKKPGYRISLDANGVQILTDTVRGVSTQIDTGKPPPATTGEKIAAYSKAFQQAEKDGNTLEQDVQIENLRSALGPDGRLAPAEELASRLRDFGRGALKVTGAPKPKPAAASPSPEDAQVTKPANPAEAAAAPTQTPTLAPTLASTQAPASAPQAKVDVSDDYEFGSKGYAGMPKPGQKNISGKQYEAMRRMDEELKLSQTRLELLEPKAKDNADTLALKKVIPYLPNRGLSQKLLKELSEGKQLSANSLKGDPFARSLLAAAKEGRLSQLNMAAIGGS